MTTRFITISSRGDIFWDLRCCPEQFVRNPRTSVTLSSGMQKVPTLAHFLSFPCCSSRWESWYVCRRKVGLVFTSSSLQQMDCFHIPVSLLVLLLPVVKGETTGTSCSFQSVPHFEECSTMCCYCEVWVLVQLLGRWFMELFTSYFLNPCG
jgi:hypothetical protein